MRNRISFPLSRIAVCVALALGAAAVIRPLFSREQSQGPQYTARVTGIPVRDAANKLLSAPFLGGVPAKPVVRPAAVSSSPVTPRSEPLGESRTAPSATPSPR